MSDHQQAERLARDLLSIIGDGMRDWWHGGHLYADGIRRALVERIMEEQHETAADAIREHTNTNSSSDD